MMYGKVKFSSLASTLLFLPNSEKVEILFSLAAVAEITGRWSKSIFDDIFDCIQNLSDMCTK